MNIIGWIHLLAASLSLITGLLALLSSKGSGRHRVMGRYYFYAMLVNNVTGLAIFNARGTWFFPHTLAVITLVILIPGFLAARRMDVTLWLRVHIFCMVASFYLLVGGAVNEVFLRVDVAKAYGLQNPQSLGLIHFGVMIFFSGLLLFYLVRSRRYRLPRI